MSLRLITPTNTEDRTRLVVDYLTSERASVGGEVRNDKELALTIEPVKVNPAGSETLYSPDHLATDSYQVAIGFPDLPPTAGTFSLTAGATTTNLTALAYNISAASLTTPLSAAFVAEGKQAGTATEVATGRFTFIGNANGAIPADFLSGLGTNLFPLSTVFIEEEDLGAAGRPYRLLIIIRQSPMCAASPSTQLPATGVDIEDVQAQSATANRIQRIFFDQAETYAGHFSITISVFGQLVSVTAKPTMSAEELGNLLNKHPLVNFNRPDLADNVSIERLTGIDGSVSFVIAWIGNQSPQAILTSSVADPSVITTAGDHGFVTGQGVTIAGHSGSTPSINSAFTLTEGDAANQFTVDENVTVAGTGGTVRPTSAPGLTVADVDLIAPQGVSGTINLNTIALNKYSWTVATQTFEVLIAVKRTRVSGEKKTIFGSATLIIDKDLFDPTTMIQTEFGDYYTSAEVDGLLATLTDEITDDISDAISAITPHIAKCKLTAEDRTNDDIQSADADLFFPIAAGETWVFEFHLHMQSASITPGWQGGLDLPTSPTDAFWYLDWYDEDTDTWHYSDQISGEDISRVIAFPVSARVIIRGSIINGANAGNVSLSWSQAVSNASPTLVDQGSYMIATKPI